MNFRDTQYFLSFYSYSHNLLLFMSRKENAQKYLETMINRYFVGVIENIFEFVIHYAYSTTLQKKTILGFWSIYF